jgi:hypothetical protein
MATTSEVKAALDDIAKSIRTERQAMTSAKARIATGQANLNALTTIFADAIAEINGYTPSGAMETLSQDELAKLTTEYVALRNEASTAVTALASITEF